MAGKRLSIAKPTLQRVESFAKGSKAGKKASEKAGESRWPPEGDVRLTANIRADLHKKLAHAAIDRNTSMGELLEMLIEKHL